ncbi:hypothetical protein DM02DRAFT_90749 [Periconia macrospinosa]|uniref:Uncharacterized protein n=1 Tax=Periconia macrospinosa TaxID=97972 RepID=A0A2V1DJ65_9PLEO|nr:hypothetical protein DM02DRAFT_90749 [Periconia macrospinosa]
MQGRGSPVPAGSRRRHHVRADMGPSFPFPNPSGHIGNLTKMLVPIELNLQICHALLTHHLTRTFYCLFLRQPVPWTVGEGRVRCLLSCNRRPASLHRSTPDRSPQLLFPPYRCLLYVVGHIVSKSLCAKGDWWGAGSGCPNCDTRSHLSIMDRQGLSPWRDLSIRQ